MKNLITLLLILTVGMTAQAQKEEVKVEAFTAKVELNISIQKKDNVKSNSVARLYKRKNSRVKKALTFTTKKNKSKMA